MSGDGAFDLGSYLASEREQVEAALGRALSRIETRVPADVARAVGHGVLGGGKRLRPILCATAYRACAGNDGRPSAAGTDALYDFAASIELVHAYSLMHDDLPCMDDADLRRGRPTTHREHGEELTMRAGLALIPAAALHAWEALGCLECPRERAVEAVTALLRAAGAGGMVGGQWLDLEGEDRSLGAEELNELHARKTGALLTASLEMGSIGAGAERPVTDALARYGAAIGLAFQIVDDVLDATQTADVLGKNPSDAALGKSTYVALYGLDGARERAVSQVDEAHAALAAAGIDSPPLEALARYVVERKS